jgi:hypothetical protein
MILLVFRGWASFVGSDGNVKLKDVGQECPTYRSDAGPGEVLIRVNPARCLPNFLRANFLSANRFREQTVSRKNYFSQMI